MATGPIFSGYNSAEPTGPIELWMVESTDTKPAARTNSGLIEINTGKIYYESGGAWVESNEAKAGGTGVRTTVDLTTMLSASLATSTNLIFALSSGTHYNFEFGILFQSGTATNGLRVGLQFPAVTYVAAGVQIPIAADGTAADFEGQITSSGDAVIGTAVEAANTTYFASIRGAINPSANGNLQVLYGGEIATTLGIVIKAGSYGVLKIIP